MLVDPEDNLTRSRPAVAGDTPDVPDGVDAAGAESEPDGGASDALGRLEEKQLGARHLSGWARWLFCLLAAAWSLFQLSLPVFLSLNIDYVRAIHLTFAIALVFLSFPAFKKHKTTGWWKFLSDKRRVPVFDIVLAIAAAGAAIYYALDYTGIAARQGMPTTRDIVVGILLVVLLLEAARRAFGPALSIVAVAFVAYAFLGSYMPRVMAFKSVSLGQLVNRLTMSNEGIYGVPLRVSAGTVFLFVLLGAMLEKSGGGRYFVNLALALLGRYRGGPAKAAVFASGLTGMVSGSSIANVVTTGTFTIPLMEESGYPPEKAAAIEVAASTNGQLMPPIMGAAAFIIAEYCNLDYLAVVRAAFIPAVVSYLALIHITHLEACKLGIRGLPADRVPRFFATFFGGIHFLLPLGALVGMLVMGFGPSHAAFWAIVLLAGLVVARAFVVGLGKEGRLGKELRKAGKVLGGSLVTGAHNMMAIGVACATAGIIVGVVTLGPGQKITEIVDVLSAGNIALILLLTAVASLVLGMGLPTTATYIVMATLTAGVIVQLGDKAGFEIPIIAAHLFCFFFGILADDTPPVGLAAYAGAAIAKSDPIKTGLLGFKYDLRTAILPFMFVFNTDLLLYRVHAWWHMGVIFVAALVGMCAFAALTQNWLFRKNRWYDVIGLILATGVLLRPGFVGECVRRLGLEASLGAGVVDVLAGKFLWYAVGVAIFAGVYALQRAAGAKAAPAG